MAWSNSRSFQAWKDRRAERMGKQGHLFENEVEKILIRMQEKENILDFIHHPSHSPEDHDGKDFTVSKIINKEKIQCSFGVTISPRSWNEAKRYHPKTPQFCFPIGTKPETIERRILELFPTEKIIENNL